MPRQTEYFRNANVKARNLFKRNCNQKDDNLDKYNGKLERKNFRNN